MAKDAHYDKVSLLLHGTGSDGSTTIVDSSKYAHNPVLFGDTKISTAQGMHGSSIVLYGNGDYIEYPNASEFNFGSGDFTIEMGFYLTSFKADTVATLLSKMDAATASGIAFALYLFGTSSSFTTIYFDAYNASNGLERVSEAYNFALNTWYKIGLSRQNNQLKIAINHDVIKTASFTSDIRAHGAPVRVGCYYPSPGVDFYLPAYVDEVRLTKGVGRDLTVPQTVQFPDLGFQIGLELTETIAADNFSAAIYDYDSKVLLNTATVSEGNTSINTLTDKTVFAVIMPDQGKVWTPLTVYTANDLVFPTDPITCPFYFKRLTNGTSGSTEPTWSVLGDDNDSSSLLYTIPSGLSTITRSAKLHANDGGTNDWQRVDRLAQPVTIGPLIPA